MTLISTLSTMQKSLSNRQLIADQDRAVQKAQREMTTGLKSDVYGDGTFRAAQTLDLRNRMARSDAFTVSNQLLAGKLSVMSTALGNIRTKTQDFQALVTAFSQGQGAEVLQANAKAVLMELNMQLNTAYAGEFLFSGEKVGAQSLTLENNDFAVAGFDDLVAAGDFAGAQALLDDYFSDQPQNTPNYLSQNYLGSDKRQVAQLDEGLALDYGLTADSVGMRDLLKGLAMLAKVDVSKISDEAALKAWVNEASASISRGISGLQDAETELGNSESMVARIIERQQKLGEIYNNRVVDIEGVDSYEAATRLEALSTQLETSYAVTVRLKNLTLLNFLK